ncbi:hypothetical protein [Roseateles sp.]|uniref:hypothetical protein n=1 Tax=Roseateles sp. TaxID=1971397 RepID=UPI004035FEFD
MLDRIRKQAFDAVLMGHADARDGGLTGTRLIRAMPEHARLPIIAMTAGAMATAVQDCLAAGKTPMSAPPSAEREGLGRCNN